MLNILVAYIEFVVHYAYIIIPVSLFIAFIDYRWTQRKERKYWNEMDAYMIREFGYPTTTTPTFLED